MVLNPDIGMVEKIISIVFVLKRIVVGREFGHRHKLLVTYFLKWMVVGRVADVFLLMPIN
jgi:hypothetical protein